MLIELSNIQAQFKAKKECEGVRLLEDPYPHTD